MTTKQAVRRTRKRVRRRRQGGGVLLPDPPMDPVTKKPYDIFYANPISNWLGFSSMFQLETPKFKAITSNQRNVGGNRPIKIGNNYAHKFFYLSSQQWYVMLNLQVMKSWWGESSNQPKNMEIFGIDSKDMWFDPQQTNNITNNPGNNNIVLRISSRIVTKEDASLLELNFNLLIKKDQQDPVVRYLRLQTFGKEALKDGANSAAVDVVGSFLGQ